MGEMTGPYTKKGLCGICPSGCGVEISMEGERLHRIKPMKGHPLGLVCTRGVHAEEIIYSPDRLMSPMKRAGKRGEGTWERVSWDEAYAMSARLIKKVVQEHGPEAMLEIGYRLAYSRLREVQPLRGAAEAARLDHRLEAA